MKYRHGSHTKHKIGYHFVWATKYRYHVLEGVIAQRARELVRQTCERFEIHIKRGVVSKDHVHILVSALSNTPTSSRWLVTWFVLLTSFTLATANADEQGAGPIGN
jgi:putative transposase